MLLIVSIVMLALLLAASADELIVRENRHEGTTDWLVDNHKDVRPGSDEIWRREKAIEGYCSHARIRTGQRLDIFISTEPASQFQIDIYRMGYYGGAGGRLMLTRGPLESTTQPTPQDKEKNLIECRWEPTLSIDIPHDWLSGVYLGKLTALPSRKQAYVIFIVRDDRKADLLFQCSDITWQSYNRWPAWRSQYDFGDNRWWTDAGNDVGFDRPYSIYLNWLPVNYSPISNGSGEFLLWEFPLAFWLEREGYDVSYISNIDTHADRQGLLRAKGWMSVGHDEYWSQEMFDNVSNARDQGVSLAFLSGNSVSGRIYIKPSTDGRANRVFGRIDRYSNTQELMGSESYGTGFSDWVVERPDHWVFDGTGMKKGDAIKDLVGWEYHGQPVGKQPSLVVLATALTRNRPHEPVREDPGEAHTAIMYDGPKGNFVFDAGTCWWNMVLSTPPGFLNPPNRDFSREDPRVQRITRNLLDAMIARRPRT
jgi:hypothetical protein